MSLLALLRAQPWALEPAELRTLLTVAQHLEGGPLPAGDLLAAGRGRATSAASELEVVDGVARIPVRGLIMRDVPRWMSYYGREATAVGDIAARIAEAEADPHVSAILLEVSSPGGTVGGVLETGEAIRAATKPTHAHIEDLGASAAYWLASQADTLAASPNASVGSIGVYTVAADFSRAAEDAGIKVHVLRSGPHKGAGVLGAPISAEQLEAIQENIDRLAETFVDAVARGRSRLSRDEVAELATGRTWIAQAAQALGLVDYVQSRASVLARIHKTTTARRAAAMADTNPSNTPAPHAAPHAPAPAPAAADIDKARQEGAAQALTEERTRAAGIRAAFSDDPAHASKHIEAGSTLLEAQADYAQVLKARAAERDEAHRKELEQARATGGGYRVRRGPEPLPSGGSSSLGPKIEGDDFVELAKARAKEKGIGVRQAMSDLAAERPALHRDYVQASTAQRKSLRRQARAARQVLDA